MDSVHKDRLTIVMAWGVPIGGVLMLLAAAPLGATAAIVAVIVGGSVYLSAMRQLQTKDLVEQHLSALAKVPELEGLEPDGRSHRIAAVAGALARALDMSETRVVEIERAARVSNIGLVASSGTKVVHTGFGEQDVARWSAAVVDELRGLAGVADLVRLPLDPDRASRDLTGDGRVTQILSIAAEFEAASSRGMTAADAAVAIQQVYGSHNPVVQALVSLSAPIS